LNSLAKKIRIEKIKGKEVKKKKNPEIVKSVESGTNLICKLGLKNVGYYRN